MDESLYWKNYTFISQEVDRAIECFYTYRELNTQALEHEDIMRGLNEVPAFWNIYQYSLHTTFFIILGRLFDDGKDTLTVKKLIAATLKHPEFFSKESLAKRKTHNIEKPDWLDEYIGRVKEPATIELRALQKALNPYVSKFNAGYRPIRDFIIAHNIATDNIKRQELFSQAKIGEVEKMLYFLHDLMQNLWQLYYNGRIPELGSSKSHYKERIRDTTKHALRRLLDS